MTGYEVHTCAYPTPDVCLVSEGCSRGGVSRLGRSTPVEERHMHMSQWTRMVTAIILGGVLHLLNPGHILALQVGDQAPHFSLPATTAETVSLADYLGKKPVVLFFYLWAFNPV